MNRRFRGFLLFAALVLLALPLSAFGGLKSLKATYFVLQEEGSSAEGNKLFLDKMLVGGEVLSSLAPTRFDTSSKSFLTRGSASFSYEADTPVPVERSGSWVLYSVALKFKAGPYPLFYKTLTVDITIADLKAGKELLQPAAKAIELAAAKAGLGSGTAWIVGMSMPSPTVIQVKVALAK
jgi:hypothetical protein